MRSINQWGRGLVLVPIEAIPVHRTGALFHSVNFNFDPAYNRQWRTVAAELGEAITTLMRGGMMEFIVHDEEMRFVIEPMEHNLVLLRLLFNVAAGISLIIGCGLSLQLMLQNARNVAIMRVLGTSKFKTRLTLLIEQSFVILVGVVAGVLVIGFVTGALGNGVVLLAGLYLVAAFIGTVVGAFVISRHAPMDLLQVQE